MPGIGQGTVFAMVTVALVAFVVMPAVMIGVAVTVTDIRGPHRACQNPREFDHGRSRCRDVPVRQADCGHRQRVLVNELLLEILKVRRRAQRVRRTDVPHDREAHDLPGSRECSTNYALGRGIGNLDSSSGFTPDQVSQSSPGTQPHLRRITTGEPAALGIPAGEATTGESADRFPSVEGRR